MFYAVIGVLAIILDQWVKYSVADKLAEGEASVLIPGLLNLKNIHNTGAAFSFLSDNPNAGKFFALFALVFTALVIVGIATNFISGRFARWCAVLVAAGGISNAIDRLIYKYVQDMFQFAFWESFPVFNVADIFITLFCFLFILCIIFGGKSASEGNNVPVEDDVEEDIPVSRKKKKAAYVEPEEEEDDEEEEVPPVRSARKTRTVEAETAPAKAVRNTAPVYKEEEAPAARRASRAAAPAAEEPESSPRKQTKAAAPAQQTRKSRQSQYADEFEQYKARKEEQRRSSPQSAPAARPAASAHNSADPFAEWERTNARISAEKAAEADAAVRTVLTEDEKKLVSPAPARPAASAMPAQQSDRTAVYQAAAPQRSAPAPKPQAPAPKPKAEVEEEFSLDDILAEFK